MMYISKPFACGLVEASLYNCYHYHYRHGHHHHGIVIITTTIIMIIVGGVSFNGWVVLHVVVAFYRRLRPGIL